MPTPVFLSPFADSPATGVPAFLPAFFVPTVVAEHSNRRAAADGQSSQQFGAQTQASNVVGDGNSSNTGTQSYLDASNKQVSGSGANGNNSGTIASYGAGATINGVDSNGIKSIVDSIAKIFAPPPAANALTGSNGAAAGTISTLPLPLNPPADGTTATGATPPNKKWWQKFLDLPTWQLFAAVAAVLVAVNLIFFRKKRA